MSSSKHHKAVLGVFVGSETIEGVLIRQNGDHVDVVQRLVRQRKTKATQALESRAIHPR